MPGAILLAAGEGKRMGGLAKPLITRDGEPLLLRQIRVLVEAGIDHVAVVLGYYAMRISEVLEKARWSGADTAASRAHLKWTINPAPDEDPASSLRCGLQILPQRHIPIVVVLGDQPLLESADIAVMLAAWRARAAQTQLLLPVHQSIPGHPVIFDGMVRDAVLAGASVRTWRAAHPEQVQTLAAPHERYTRDLDTPQDLQALAATGVRLQLPDSRP